MIFFPPGVPKEMPEYSNKTVILFSFVLDYAVVCD